MKSSLRPDRRHGFTLVELLVVIAIIGILTAILIPTLSVAIKNSREAALKFELTQLAAAMEEYQNKSGQTYPPDFTSPQQAVAYVEAHVNKISRNHDAGRVTTYLNSIDDDNNVTNGLVSDITPDEALVFWLAGTDKSGIDPLGADRLPVPTSPAAKPDVDINRVFFQFNDKRLRDNDDDGYFSYLQSYGKEAPYVYFDSRTYAGTISGAPSTVPAQRTSVFDPSAHMFPEASGIARPYTNSDGSDFMEPNTFQILAAGYDGDYGANQLDKRIPLGSSGSSAFNRGDRDNFSSFVDRRFDADLDN